MSIELMFDIAQALFVPAIVCVAFLRKYPWPVRESGLARRTHAAKMQYLLAQYYCESSCDSQAPTVRKHEPVLQYTAKPVFTLWE